jgi:hypothetical protein
MGKGLAGMHSLQRKHRLDCWARLTMLTSLKGIAFAGRNARMVKASMPEEPGAIVSHAGICEGAVG